MAAMTRRRRTIMASRSRRRSPSAPAITAQRVAASSFSTRSPSAAARAISSTSAPAPACWPSPRRGPFAGRWSPVTSMPSLWRRRSVNAAAQWRRSLRPCGRRRAALIIPPSTAGFVFDLITANILAAPLRELAPALAKALKSGGEIVLSGLLGRDVPGIVSAYRTQHLRLVGRLDIDGWATLLMRREMKDPRMSSDRSSSSAPVMAAYSLRLRCARKDMAASSSFSATKKICRISARRSPKPISNVRRRKMACCCAGRTSTPRTISSFSLANVHRNRPRPTQAAS